MEAAANLFPTARADAPDLKDDEVPLGRQAGGFPQAPSPSAFGKSSVGGARETITKVDRAIEIIRTKGRATRREIADQLGIQTGHVAAYLATPIKNGVILRDGDYLVLSGASNAHEPAAREPDTPPPRKRSRERPRPRSQTKTGKSRRRSVWGTCRSSRGRTPRSRSAPTTTWSNCGTVRRLRCARFLNCRGHHDR